MKEIQMLINFWNEAERKLLLQMKEIQMLNNFWNEAERKLGLQMKEIYSAELQSYS